MSILSVASTVTLFAQTNVTGTVTDTDGEPISGATVMVPGTTRGTSTRADGTYALFPGDAKSLEYTCLGYKTQTIELTGQAIINVIMEEDRTSLDEVVVVGYGVQKRRDIVGAIETLAAKDVGERLGSSMSIARSLQGAVPGLTLTFSDGKPTRDATVRIRGNTNSIGAGGSALILLDGMEVDLNSVNPETIETITVLKDASSTAVYGSRGTFGVILLTSKNPEKGHARITYDGTFNIYSRTVKPDMVTNGYEWTTSFLEAYNNAYGADPTGINNRFSFSRSWYEELERRNSDPSAYDSDCRINSNGEYEYFGNNNWYKMFYNDYYYGHQHTVTVQGGSDVASFYVSGRFFQQDGVYRVGDEIWNRYNVTAKGTVNVKPWLRVSESANFMYLKYHEDGQFASGTTATSIPALLSCYFFPVATPRNPDGTWTNTATQGYAEFVDNTAYREHVNTRFNSKTLVELDIIKDVLYANADFGYEFFTQDRILPQYSFPYCKQEGVVTNYAPNAPFYEWYRMSHTITGDATLTYAPRLGKNNTLKIMAGWNIQDYELKATRLFSNGLTGDPSNTPNWNFVDSDNVSIRDQGSYGWGVVGAFYRVNYSYKSKYLVETSGRYDGSSKFPINSQWGFFPSGSVGWRISEEGFMKKADWLDNLKIRASIGSAGNGLMSDAYAYLSTMSLTSNTSFLSDGSTFKYTSAPDPTPDQLTWESAITYDVGVDFEAFDGRLNFVGDIYRKNTVNMYVTGEELPAVYGNSAPKGNYADMRTDGYELSLGWRDNYKVGGKTLSYYVKGSFWDSNSIITRYTSKTGTLPTIYSTNYYEGMTLGEIWGYVCNGLFQSWDDVENSASMDYFAQKKQVFSPGDPKFEDLNGDGVVNRGDNTIYNHGDLVVIGNTSPRYLFSLQAGISWNGIGLSMMWQGVGKRDWYPAKYSGYFWGQYDYAFGMLYTWQVKDRWSEENPNGYWPRLVGYESQAGMLAQPNTRYLQNARYLRLKNLTIDYTFPTKIVKKIGLQALKVYTNFENLLTFTPLHKYAKNYDPEGIYAGDADNSSTAGAYGSGDGEGYPVLKTITIGLSITL